MISKRVLKTAEGWLNKRDDLLEEERSALLNYIKPMKNVEALATARWFVNEVIRVHEDQTKVNEAIKVAKSAKVDPLTYPSPMSILNTFKQYKIKEKAIDPDTVPELSNGRTVGPPSFSIRVYDVEDSKEGQLAMRKIINTHWGEDANPWCLLQGDGEGNLSSNAWYYWNHYNGVPKRVAFKDGRLLAFCASNYAKNYWWDRQDNAHNGISFDMKMPNDELGREATYEISSNGALGNPTNIHRGDKQNGIYEEWWENGQIMSRENYKDGVHDGPSKEWYENGKQRFQENYKDGEKDGLQQYWYPNGEPYAKQHWNNGELDGPWEEWSYNGNLISRGNHKNGKKNGVVEEWWENGQMKLRCNYKEGLPEGLDEEWYANGQLCSRKTYMNGKLDGLYELWNENGRLTDRMLYKGGEEVEDLTNDVRFRKYLERKRSGQKAEFGRSKEEEGKKIILKPKKKRGIKI